MNYNTLITAISDAHRQAQAGAAGAVNRYLILRNWLIGAYLVEFEQNGEDRAAYGARLLTRVSADLNAKDVSGCSRQMLERMRQLYLLYPQIADQISSPLVSISPAGGMSVKCSPLVSISRSASIAPSCGKLPTPIPTNLVLRLSWTHLVELLAIGDPWKRAFFENECLKGNWSKRQLQRQIGSLLYERTGLSTDKHAVIEHARQQAADAPTDIASLIRDPYVLEFTGLAEKPHYLESDATGGLDHQLFVSRYLVALPAPEQLQQLVETDRVVWQQRHPEVQTEDSP